MPSTRKPNPASNAFGVFTRSGTAPEPRRDRAGREEERGKEKRREEKRKGEKRREEEQTPPPRRGNTFVKIYKNFAWKPAGVAGAAVAVFVQMDVSIVVMKLLSVLSKLAIDVQNSAPPQRLYFVE